MGLFHEWLELKESQAGFDASKTSNPTGESQALALKLQVAADRKGWKPPITLVVGKHMKEFPFDHLNTFNTTPGFVKSGQTDIPEKMVVAVKDGEGRTVWHRNKGTLDQPLEKGQIPPPPPPPKAPPKRLMPPPKAPGRPSALPKRTGSALPPPLPPKRGI